jgi:hypothetical protein
VPILRYTPVPSGMRRSYGPVCADPTVCTGPVPVCAGPVPVYAGPVRYAPIIRSGMRRSYGMRQSRSGMCRSYGIRRSYGPVCADPTVCASPVPVCADPTVYAGPVRYAPIIRSGMRRSYGMCRVWATGFLSGDGVGRLPGHSSSQLRGRWTRTRSRTHEEPNISGVNIHLSRQLPKVLGLSQKAQP